MSDRDAHDGPLGRDGLAPRRPDNRPGLDELAYRVGTHSAFLRRMRWRIPRERFTDPLTGEDLQPLRGLTVRETSDPTIALMDAWATALDVLTFYSERIANEGYVATARERRSMVELARSIGYELTPGVAASVHLAFTVEDADDPYRSVDVPVGTQAVSVPQEKGALPQTYETTEAIRTRAEWNAMPAQTETPQHLALRWPSEGAAGRGELYLFDLDNSFDTEAAIAAGELAESDVVEITDPAELDPWYPVDAGLDLAGALADLQEDAASNTEIDPTLRAVPVTEVNLRGIGRGLAPGDRLLAVGARQTDDAQQVAASPFRVVEAEPDRDHDLTRVVLAPLGGDAPPQRRGRPRLRPAKLRIGTVPAQSISFDETSVHRQVTRTAWTGATLRAFLSVQQWPRRQLMRLVRQAPPVAAPPLGEAAPGFHVLRQRLGFFGNTAGRQESLANPDETRGGADDDPYPASWDKDERTIWTDSQGQGLGDRVDAYLEREVEQVTPGQWALVENPSGQAVPLRVATAAGTSRTDFALTGKATGLGFRRADGSAVDTTATDLAAFTFRSARAYVVSERLPQAGAPLLDPLTRGADEVTLDSLYLDLQPGRSVSVTGERADAPGVRESETLGIDDVLHVGGVTRIVFAGGPTYAYRRSTVRINANVAPATHGESYAEDLGSGDATRANQAFALAKPPLTFVSAGSESGLASTLTVRVGGVAWAEVGSLHDSAPGDEVYQVRIDDSGTTRVTFGDGQHGRRLPTGQLNVSAFYRSGVGTVGETPDETIIQLKTRPLGIRSVVNPSRATGSAEPETLEDARERAPQSVRTLGRIVSLTDYADFARGFAGIGKAASVALWLGHERVAHVTVAPQAEGVFAESDQALVNLRDAVAALRNRTHRAVVAPHAVRLFTVSARLVHDPRHRAEDIEAAARAGLDASFGYDARALGQSVSAAEVVAALHGVVGVVAVDLDRLDPYPADPVDGGAPGPGEDDPPVPALLRARPARVVRADDGSSVAAPAELLTVLGAGVILALEADDA